MQKQPFVTLTLSVDFASLLFHRLDGEGKAQNSLRSGLSGSGVLNSLGPDSEVQWDTLAWASVTAPWTSVIASLTG